MNNQAVDYIKETFVSSGHVSVVVTGSEDGVVVVIVVVVVVVICV